MNEDTKITSITVQIESDLKFKAKMEALKRGMTLKEVVEQALRKFTEETKK